MKIYNMNPYFLLKLATKQPEVYTPPRTVPLLAQVKALQLNIPLPWLLHGKMTTVMNYLTNNLKNGTITTKQANKEIEDYTGAVNDFARLHTIEPQDDEESKRLKVLNSKYGKRIGYPGACDAVALVHEIEDPNVIKGMGENALSMNKFQNMFNIKNIGSMGRNGGSSLA